MPMLRRGLVTYRSPEMLVDEEYFSRLANAHEVLVSLTQFPTLEILSEREAQTSDSLDLRNLVGIGIGEKLVGGKPAGMLAVRAYVVRKAPLREVKVDIGEHFRQLLAYFGTIATDVVEVGRLQLFSHIGKRFLPQVPGGVGIGNANIGHHGTLGAWVTDGTDDYLLSCWHVMADPAQGGNDVVHPDASRGGTKVATLFCEAAPDLSPAGMSKVDAALAKRDPTVTAGHFILWLGQVSGTAKVKRTQYAVVKTGVQTHCTRGWITDLKATMKLDVPGTGHTATYRDQLAITPDYSYGEFAAPGDSGAIVLDEAHNAVGMVVGGGRSSTQVANHLTIATPIDVVISSLMYNGNLGRLDFFTYP